MQMQLDTLHTFGLVLPHRLFRLDNTGRLQNHLFRVGIIHHLALYRAVQTVFDFGSGVACLIRGKEFRNAHGIGAVSHVKGDFDVILAGFLAVDVLVICEEHLALNGNHIVCCDRLIDRDDRVLHQLAEN